MKSLRSFPLITLILLLPAIALAQAVTTTTSTVPDLLGMVEQGENVYEVFKVGGFLAGLSALVNFLVNATKVGFINEYIKSKKLKWVRVLLAVILGFLAGLGAALAEGKSTAMAILWTVAGMTTGGGAVMLHELVQSFKGWRESRKKETS